MSTMRRRAFLAGLGAAGAAVAAACSSTARRRSSQTAPATTQTTGQAPTVAPATTTAPGGPATFLRHGPATSTGVALTFHTAGDPAITQSLLDQAAASGAKLTFFVVGVWAAANPTLIRKILDGGHELGNHTWSHINLPALGPTAMHAEIARCADELRRQTGSISRWFRPSQTDVPSAAILTQAGSVGYGYSVGYDVDPLDYTNPGASLVEQRVKARLHPGAIVSLHTLYQGTATAFTPIVEAIHAAGLRPVTTSAVLGV